MPEGGGALPYVGRYRLSFDPPFCTPILHPITLCFLQSTPSGPLFSTFVTNFAYKLYIFLHFAHILRNFKDLRHFNMKFANFGLKLHFCTLNDPPFLGVHTKKDPFFFLFETTPNDPLFSTKSYTECPLLSFSGRHMYATFIFECPPQVMNLQGKHKISF